MDIQQQIIEVKTLATSIKAQLSSSNTLSHPIEIPKSQLDFLSRSIPDFTQILRDNNSNSDQMVQSLHANLDADSILVLLHAVHDDQELRKDICALVECFLDSVSFRDIFPVYRRQLLSTLGGEAGDDGLSSTSISTDSQLRLLALAQLKKACVSIDEIRLLISDREFWPRAVIGALGDEDLRVSNAVKELLVQICHVDPGFLCPVDQSVLRELSRLLSCSSSVVGARVFDVVAECQSITLLRAYRSLFEVISKWLCNGDDMLLQVSALDILSKVVQCDGAVEFLTELGIIADITRIVSAASVVDGEDHPFNDLLVAQCIVFFGRLGQFHPRQLFVIDAQYHVIKFIMDGVGKVLVNQQLAEASATAIGQIASSDEGLVSVDKHYPSAWTKLATSFSRSSSQTYLAFLRAFAAIFSGATSPAGNAVAEKLFVALGSSHIVNDFCKSARNSFADYKMCGYAVLRGLASREFGARCILDDGVLVTEFLLNRNIEATHEGQLAHFDLVKQLVDTMSQSTPTPSEQTHLMRLKEYVTKGVYYSKSVAQVALDTLD
eukprot:Partr_v1_DN28496_c0_g1_i3_m42211 putative proteasome (prosome, macropain) 26S subunit, non-ATPase, 5